MSSSYSGISLLKFLQWQNSSVLRHFNFANSLVRYAEILCVSLQSCESSISAYFTALSKSPVLKQTSENSRILLQIYSFEVSGKYLISCSNISLDSIYNCPEVLYFL